MVARAGAVVGGVTVVFTGAKVVWVEAVDSE